MIVVWLPENPDEREAMAVAALQRGQSLGGWDTYGERCLAMYRKVIDRKRGCVQP